MNVDVIVVGQGLCGTVLSFELEQRCLSYLVVDNAYPWTGTRASSGILNPVMGRKRQPLPGLAHLLPAALELYEKLGKKLGMALLRETTITEFHQSAEDAQAFEAAEAEAPDYLHSPADGGLRYDSFFHNRFGTGETAPAYTVDLAGLLPAWRAHLEKQSLFRQAHFSAADLCFDNGSIYWQDVNAKKIIFCSGIGTLEAPPFSNLPLNANKGEALLISIPGLPRDRIFKMGSRLTLVPMFDKTEALWWAGASFDWKFSAPGPTAAFRERTEAILSQWLKCPYTVADAIAGTRPTTLDRNAVMGWHPDNPTLGILNGMGTKGVVQAPYLAAALAESIVADVPLEKNVSVQRFERALRR